MSAGPRPERAERAAVVVTGASGLIGSALCETFAPDYPVFALDVVEPDRLPDGARFQHCDLTDDESTRDAVETVARESGGRIASVAHLAAYYDFSGAPSPLYETLTVEGTRRLLRALRASDAAVEQVVFSSSLLVMKPGASEDVAPLEEDSPVAPAWEYPRSKVEAEEVISRERGDIPAVILRIAGVYDEDGHSPPITQQIWRIREKKLESFLFPGNPHHGQAFVHREDVARCFRQAVERRAELGPWEVFLVAEPEVLSYGELQDRIGERLHGREWPTLRIPAPVAKAGAWMKETMKRLVGDEDEVFIKPWMIDLADAHRPVSVERARERLGWSPRHRLSQTLPEMLDRLERDPKGFYEENGLPVDEGEAE